MGKAGVQKAVNRLAAIDAECKALYAERDGIESNLIEAIQASGGKLELPGERRVTLRDNFVNPVTGLSRNVAFKTAAVKRFEIQIA